MAWFSKTAISGAIYAVSFALGGPLGLIGMPVARLAQTWPQTVDINGNGAILVFWLYVKKRTKRHVFFCDSARSPHRTTKPSRGRLCVYKTKGNPRSAACK